MLSGCLVAYNRLLRAIYRARTSLEHLAGAKYTRNIPLFQMIAGFIRPFAFHSGLYEFRVYTMPVDDLCVSPSVQIRQKKVSDIHLPDALNFGLPDGFVHADYILGVVVLDPFQTSELPRRRCLV